MTGHQFLVLADKATLVEAAADRIAAALADVGERGAVCLTGGGTIVAVYRRLAEAPFRDRIPVDRLDWFLGDERFVPLDHDLSNFRQACETLLDPLGVPTARRHPIPTDDDVHAAARRYEDVLAQYYGAGALDPARPLFDLVLMGMGADGHTASLFPGHPTVDEAVAWVVGVDQAGVPPFGPRVSLTLPALASTRTMLFIVSGAEKRPAASRVRAGDDLPAARAKAAGDLLWLVDRAAAPETLGATEEHP